jgi:hypothetical protein
MDISYSCKNRKSLELPLVLPTFRKRKTEALQFDFVVIGSTGSAKDIIVINIYPQLAIRMKPESEEQKKIKTQGRNVKERNRKRSSACASQDD